METIRKTGLVLVTLFLFIRFFVDFVQSGMHEEFKNNLKYGALAAIELASALFLASIV